jgi:hypothetical protein
MHRLSSAGSEFPLDAGQRVLWMQLLFSEESIHQVKMLILNLNDNQLPVQRPYLQMSPAASCLVPLCAD